MRFQQFLDFSSNSSSEQRQQSCIKYLRLVMLTFDVLFPYQLDLNTFTFSLSIRSVKCQSQKNKIWYQQCMVLNTSLSLPHIILLSKNGINIQTSPLLFNCQFSNAVNSVNLVTTLRTVISFCCRRKSPIHENHNASNSYFVNQKRSFCFSEISL